MAERRFDDVMYVHSDRRAGKSCDVPYRSLVPKRIDGLLASGRASHVFPPHFRARYCALLNGQAAGIAAAMCVQAGVQPRDLDVREFQKALLRHDCPLGTEARLKELGLR
jgi:hypothetical protein